MGTEMTSRERFKRMYEHREADRVPIIDEPWSATIERWTREGMPEGADYREFFGLDMVGWIRPDNSPRYEEKVIEETDEYKITTTEWGVTLRNWKHIASTPEFIDFSVKDRATWAEAKSRMSATPDRINWDYLRKNYPKWKDEGYWVTAAAWFGFDATHAWFVGTERILMALVEDPEWCVDMFNHELEVSLKLLDMIWDEGYHFDSVMWWDDMGYKLNQFFSMGTYRELLKPAHKKAIDWAHEKGIKAHLHSCGDVRPFVPELIEMGLDGLNPLEVKAGMDPILLKKTYGDRLVLHGGINAALWGDSDAIEAEMRRVVPILKESGGYIFSSDHSIPSSVSLEGFRTIVRLAKELGSYG